MTLEDLGNLGEFIGGLAVIATLIYLAVQIRQNSKLLRASVEQTTRSDSTAILNLMAASTENASVYHRGLTDSAVMSPEERTHFYLLLAANFYHFQQAYAAHQDGIQSEETWNTQWQALQFYASQPGVRTWWKQQGRRLIAVESKFWHLADSEMRKHEKSAA